MPFATVVICENTGTSITMDPVAQLGDDRLDDDTKPTVRLSKTAVPHASLGYATAGVNEAAVCTPTEAASQTSSGNVVPVAGENAVCSAVEVEPHMSSSNGTPLADELAICPQKEPPNVRCRVSRNRYSAEWKFDLLSTGLDEMSTRTQTYGVFDHECVSFLTCLTASERATLRPGAGLTLEIHSHSWVCQVCARFRAGLSKRAVFGLVKGWLPINIVVISVTVIRDWAGTVEKARETDVKAVYKGIEETCLHWKTRLWMQIVHGGMRSFPSADSRFCDMVAQHVGAKSIFEQLLFKHRKEQNMLSPRRITYRDCTDPKTVDTEIMRDVEWAKHVIDWFAERLIPADLNSRSLYL